MRVSSNASRAASAVLAAVLASSVCMATLARAQSVSAESSTPIRSAAIEPSATVEAVPSATASSDDLGALPPTSDAPPQSDFKEPAKEEQPVTVAPAAPTQALDPQGEAILARLKDGKPLLQRLPSKEREAMQVFYTIADFKPIWIANGAFTPAAQSVIARLRAAAEDGLDPSAYPIPALAGAGRTMSAAEVADAELKLSAAVVLYARDARGGRVNLASISKLITPDLNLTPADLILGQLAVSGTEAGDRLQAYNPNQPGYLALKQRLATARGSAVPSTNANTPVRIPVGPVLKIGMSDPRVRLLREHFGLPERSEGTLDAAPGEPELYDKAVADAVAGFQRSHGLPDNGNLTRSTIVSLALPESFGARAGSGDEAELISNMERWRWLPRDLGSDYVLVNVPEYRLRVYRGGVMRDETRVIVGKTDSPTPIFSGAMETAVVNPSWFVPPSILKTMLASGRTNGFEVVRRHGQISLRQPPGERNALGFIKFLFPNQHAVYLHDTPNRSLFSASKRAFSHGCVRVDDPFRFADAVLPDAWTEASLRKLIGKGERSIKLPEKLPVHIAYFTAYVDDSGVYRTLPDLYGYDARIKEALGLTTRPGAMASFPTEPARRAASAPVAQVAQPHAASRANVATRANVAPRSVRPHREAVRAPVERYAAQRPRRYAPAGYGEPGLWTPAPAPSASRTWW